MKKGTDFGKNIAKKYVENYKAGTLGIMGKAFGEGLEETAEELVTDLVKYTGEVAGEFGLMSQTDLGAFDNDDSDFEITKFAKGAYLVSGGKLNRLAKVTDARNTEQVVRLQNIMKSMGVFDELKKRGLKNGDTVVLAHLEFAYYDDEIWG